MYLLLIVEYVGRIGLSVWKPVETSQTPPGAIANYLLSAIGVAMLVISLRRGPASS